MFIHQRQTSTARPWRPRPGKSMPASSPAALASVARPSQISGSIAATPDTPMHLRVFVNGEATVTSAATLAELVAQFGFPETGVATALNGDFVPRGAREATRLVGDDKVEIVSPRQGG